MLLSIVVLSYNRPAQIDRILKHFIGFEDDRVQLIIKDDVSPRIIEIQQIIDEYKCNKLKINIKLIHNNKNLGYDSNLLDSFKVVDSDYIFLLSDDDYINTKYFHELLNILEHRIHNFYFTPYFRKNILNRYKIGTYNFDKFPEVIYNSILFSGLIFETKEVNKLNLNIEFLKNSLYTQVYIAALLIYQSEKFGEMPRNILYVGEDGENFFGKNQSATNKNLIANRNTIEADLNYQGFLIKVVKEISFNTDLQIEKMFLREYKKRLFGYLFRSRACGITTYSIFVRSFLSSHANRYYFHIFTLIILFFIPSYFAKYIYNLGVKHARYSG